MPGRRVSRQNFMHKGMESGFLDKNSIVQRPENMIRGQEFYFRPA